MIKKIFAFFVAIAVTSTLWAKVDYLSFTATGASSVELNYGGTLVGVIPYVEYSFDQVTWYNHTVNTYFDDNKIALKDGETVYMRGYNPNYFSIRQDGYSYFRMTGSIAAGGDLMTLIDSTGVTTAIPRAFCFYWLFMNCSSLTKAPKLTATNLLNYTYGGLFQYCSNLNYIEVNFTEWDANITTQWVYSVGSKGTFVKPKALPILYGNDYIPTGWDVVNIEDISTDLDELSLVSSTTPDVQKVIIDGQLFILRDGKTYTAMGAELR